MTPKYQDENEYHNLSLAINSEVYYFDKDTNGNLTIGEAYRKGSDFDATVVDFGNWTNGRLEVDEWVKWERRKNLTGITIRTVSKTVRSNPLRGDSIKKNFLMNPLVY